MNKICFGCGVKLQSVDKNKLGYIPEKRKDSAKYCMRCFRMINYGENKVANTPKEAKEIINKINKDVRFVIFLVDFLNINSEVIKLFKAIKKGKILVINKCELIPKHISRERIKNFVRDNYEISEPIILKGGTTTHGARSVLRYLNDEFIREAYILGISNSGKSTLINDLIDICGTNVTKTTVNNKANTTLDFIRVKLNDKLTLIDSPGVILENSLNHDTNGKNITAYNFNMKDCETIGLISNKYFLKFETGTPITFYTNIQDKKVIKKYFRAAPDLVNALDIDDNRDVIINGLGFITVKKKTKITTNIDLKYIEVRKSMFGGNNE